MFILFALYLISVPLIHYALASSPMLGSPCTTAHDHLDPQTRALLTSCDAQTVCSAPLNGTCRTRSCRRDTFAFGYAYDDPIPPLCPSDSFCPDEGDECRSLVSPGQGCQFNRDDQCAPPEDQDAALELSDPQNNNGSICVKSVCMYANVTAGQSCVYELTGYTTADHDGQDSTNIIVRDNCRTAEFFCDSSTSLCVPVKEIGQQCQYNRDCRSYTCLNNACASSSDAPVDVAIWQYIVTCISIISAMITTCVMLTLMHKRNRLESYNETRDYCYEQITLRRRIMALQHGGVALDRRP